MSFSEEASLFHVVFQTTARNAGTAEGRLQLERGETKHGFMFYFKIRILFNLGYPSGTHSRGKVSLDNIDRKFHTATFLQGKLVGVLNCRWKVVLRLARAVARTIERWSSRAVVREWMIRPMPSKRKHAPADALAAGK